MSTERRPWPFAAALVAIWLPAAAAEPPSVVVGDQPRLVLLPTENSSGDSGAPDLILPLVEDAVRSRGWDLISGEPIERQLAAARIRRLGSLPAEARETLLRDLKAQGYVATSILAFRADGIPLVAMAARFVGADGVERYGDVQGLSAEDLIGTFEDRPSLDVEELAGKVVERLFESFPRAGEKASQDAPPGPPLQLGSPASFRSPALEKLPAPRRVAVLPFRSFVEDRLAPRMAAELATFWLARMRGFEPVEAADLREAMVAEHVRDPSQLDPERLAAIGRRIGTSLFLKGTVFEWRREPSGGSQGAPPIVELSLIVVDASSARILWMAHHHRRGDQYQGLLGLGALTNIVAVANRVIGEMIDTME